MTIRVTKCLCYDVDFALLVRLSRATGKITLEALQDEVTFGKRCRLCHPYVRRALLTGETVFTELLFDDQPSVDTTERDNSAESD